MTMHLALAFGLMLFSPAQGKELTTGWTVAHQEVPEFFDDGYDSTCDLKSNDFQIDNMKEYQMPHRKSFSWVSVWVAIQSLVLILVTLMLPPKFPISPWQDFRAPKKYLLSHLKEQLLKVQTLREGDEEWFLHGGKEVKEKILRNLLSILEGTDVEKAKLVWSDEEDEFTARSLEQLATRSAHSLNLENMEPVEWWTRTQLFRCCYDPQDPYRVLGFNLAMAHKKSLDFDETQAMKFMETQMKRPASKMGVALPWSQSMQILIATVSALSAPFLPILSMFKRRFWLWYTPTYWALSFRPPVLLEVVFNVLKAYVGLMAWDKLTGNQGAVWEQTHEFPWFRRRVGGPFQRFANVPIYGLFSQIALQVNFVPSFIFHIVALAGLLAALLGCQIFLVKLFERCCSIARWSSGSVMSESLLNAPRSPEQHFNTEPSRTDAFAVFRRCRTQAEAEARKHLNAAKDAWQLITGCCSEVCRSGEVCRSSVQIWRDSSPESRRFVTATLINTVFVLPLMIPLWLSLVNRWQPNSSGTYLCTFSRLRVLSLHVDSISGFAFLLILGSFAIGLMLVLLQGMNILTAVVDVNTHSFQMFLWQSFQKEFSMKEAFDAFNNQQDMSHVPQDQQGNRRFKMWWIQTFKETHGEVPPVLRTEAFYTEAIQQKGLALEHVPENMKTEAMCTEAVKQKGLALEYVPQNLKTEAVCTAAIQQDGRALTYVPENMKTEAMCMQAVKHGGTALRYVPENVKTEAICIEAVKQAGYALEYVPEKMKTEAICIEAVKQKGYALKGVPKNMRTEAICIEAVKQNGLALYLVPENMKTEAICIEAVKQNEKALDDVPADMREAVQTKAGR